ncbi:hypothetical protein [Psychromarinibacter halotolerans]|uniref:Uncharacterized protein n=1 Tax=Psychromarinibacter halotolerans TaxID=1775175 RepID=A0ABV7GWK1_9RHOB|nr:hypothetical protein [Psychromarinibacter halotolerans]MDF0597489.1 hypothetical protein [Psychromarinibacter halotolerans]
MQDVQQFARSSDLWIWLCGLGSLLLLGFILPGQSFDDGRSSAAHMGPHTSPYAAVRPDARIDPSPDIRMGSAMLLPRIAPEPLFVPELVATASVR